MDETGKHRAGGLTIKMIVGVLVLIRWERAKTNKKGAVKVKI